MDDYLNKSLDEYNRKKQDCINVVEETLTLLKAYKKETTDNEQKLISSSATPDSESENKERLSEDYLDELKKKLAAEKINLLIAGQFKQGKSTLVNALFGEEILPSAVRPCTAVITEVLWDNETDIQPWAEITFKDDIENVPEDIPPKAQEYIGKHKPHVPPLPIKENLKETLEDYLVIGDTDKEQDEAVGQSPFDVCTLHYPLELCKKGIVITDSPGLNEANSRDKITMDYVSKADIILHVLSALATYSKTDMDFIKDAKRLGVNNMIFAVNRFDQLNNDKGREDIRKYAYSKLKNQTKFGEEAIFFTSAAPALEARQNNDAEAFEKSGFSLFERKLGEIIEKDRVQIKIKGNFEPLCGKIKSFADDYIVPTVRFLDCNSEELKKKLKENEKKFEELEAIKNNIITKIEKTKNRSKKELELEFRTFLSNFISSDIPAVVYDVEFDSYGLYCSENDVKGYIQKLNDAVKDHIKDTSEFWVKNNVSSMIQKQLQELSNDIALEMKRFEAELEELRKNMAFDDAVVNVETISVKDLRIDIGDIGKIIGGGIIGGVAGGALYVALEAIFQGVFKFFGPLGWIIGAVAGGIIEMLRKRLFGNSSEKIFQKIKEEYILQADKQLFKELPNLSADVTEKISEKVDTQLSKISPLLQENIDKQRKPVQDAIAMLEANQQNIEPKKERLNQFILEFKKLGQKANSVLNEL